MTSSAVHSAAEKARKMSNKLDKAETKIPKKSVKRSQRCIDEKTGTYTTRLYFEEIDKKRPPSKLSHAVSSAPLNSMSHAVHRDIRESEDDNVGVESAHKLEEVAEGGVRFMDSALREQKLKPYRNADRAEIRADKANLQALNRYARDNQPEFTSNPYSRLQQKRAIKKEYAAAKAGRSASGTVRASELTKKAAKATEEGSKKVAAFFAKHKKGLVVIGILAVMLIFMLNVFSSCSVILQSGVSAFGATTHPADDTNLLAAEEQYCSLEAELQEYLNNYERTHDYDEYHYDLDAIEHDPYVLLAALSALHGDEWTVSDVSGYIQFLFEKQYILTETVETETRYRRELRVGYRTETDPVTGSTRLVPYLYYVDVPYTYYICTVKLENFNLSHVPIYVMSEEQLSRYAAFMATLGNRPDLFPSSSYVDRYYHTDYPVYEIPEAALEDEVCAAMIEKAEEYLGYPYVWGGYCPNTSFDCSGFVSWVINNCGVGWNYGRLGAESLRHICSYVSPTNAQPGDLIFFQGTYDTPGASHVGIYVGGGMMIHCGDPIQYSSINTSYNQAHFLSFGRLPRP